MEYKPNEKQDRLTIIGQNIKRYRIARNLSQEQLANMCGHTNNNARSWVSKIESGVNDIPATELNLVANALGVQPNELLNSSVSEVPTPTLTPSESAHLSRYRALDAEDQDTVDGLTESLLSKSKYHTQDDSGRTGAA